MISCEGWVVYIEKVWVTVKYYGDVLYIEGSGIIVYRPPVAHPQGGRQCVQRQRGQLVSELA